MRKDKRKQSQFFFFFYIMHEQGGMSRRTEQDQINRRSEALMMWRKCNTKPRWEDLFTVLLSTQS